MSSALEIISILGLSSKEEKKCSRANEAGVRIRSFEAGSLQHLPIQLAPDACAGMLALPLDLFKTFWKGRFGPPPIRPTCLQSQRTHSILILQLLPIPSIPALTLKAAEHNSPEQICMQVERAELSFGLMQCLP
jgi:hypothetical protein